MLGVLTQASVGGEHTTAANIFCLGIIHFNKEFTVIRHYIFWCASESTSKILSKSQLDKGIFILNIIHFST